MGEIIVCTPRALPKAKVVAAAAKAIEANPANQPPTSVVSFAMAGKSLPQFKISVMVGKRWPASGVRLTVGFLDTPPVALKAKILSHMNAWGKTANVVFKESKTDPDVRIARLDSPPEDSGYWSYVGTDILSIAADAPTMNLEGFTMKTPTSEFVRVVRHETGHTLGFPHEHMRKELVDRIDAAKAIKFFRLTQGWSEKVVRQQVLTPIEEASILGTPHADPNSIMCYQIPGTITKDGKPIIGGVDIDKDDRAFAASVYPKKVK